MTDEERAKLIRHLKYNRSIGADYLITDKDADEIIKALEQEPILDKIRAEMEQIEINGHIRDVECFRAGINVALNIIDKYKAESEE